MGRHYGSEMYPYACSSIVYGEIMSSQTYSGEDYCMDQATVVYVFTAFIGPSSKYNCCHLKYEWKD